MIEMSSTIKDLLQPKWDAIDDSVVLKRRVFIASLDTEFLQVAKDMESLEFDGIWEVMGSHINPAWIHARIGDILHTRGKISDEEYKSEFDR